MEKCKADLRCLVQGMATEKAVLLNGAGRSQASRHGPFPAALAQLSRGGCQHLNDVICDARLGLQTRHGQVYYVCGQVYLSVNGSTRTHLAHHELGSVLIISLFLQVYCFGGQVYSVCVCYTSRPIPPGRGHVALCLYACLLPLWTGLLCLCMLHFTTFPTRKGTCCTVFVCMAECEDTCCSCSSCEYMPTIALRSRTLMPMRPVKSMLGLVTKQMCDHMLQQCDDSCIVFLCIDIKATRRAGGGDAANT